MKIIFNELHPIIFQEREVVYRHGQRAVEERTLGNDLAADSPSFKATCTASYDKATGALYVKLDAHLYRDWAPAGHDFAEVHPTREQAIRRVIHIADHWYATVERAIPPLPLAADLLAQFEKEIPY